MSNIVHSSVGGFVVQQQPNVNAAYGPWDSLNDAKVFLQQHFLEVDENMHIAPNIPIGTTVAIYADQTKQTIIEYWWSKGDLVQKTFGGSQYTLKLIDEQGKLVSSISINEGYYNTPAYIRPLMLKTLTNESVDFGYIQFSIDGESYIKYNPNSRAHSNGIPTSDVTRSLVVEWRDVDDTLIAYSDVIVHNLPNIVQEFYAYNNSEKTAPTVTLYDITSPTYQGEDWSPNDYGQSDWGLIRKGIDDLNHVEWRVSRTRTNGLWSKLQGPFISSRWGIDAIIADKQILYYYSPNLIEGKLDDEFSYDLGYLKTHVPNDIVLTEDYTVVNTETNTTRVWTPTYKSVDPYNNRYCYVTQRQKVIEDGQYVFGWTTVALYTNFAVDGKDADDIEYIYCLSKTNPLDDKAKEQLKAINAQHSTKGMVSGSEINFDNWIWTDNPSGISLENPYEFCAKRDITKDYSGKVYHEFEPPFLWASYGKEGPDGPGLEYIYIATSSKSEVPTIDCSSKDSRDHDEQQDDYLPKYIKGDVVREWSDDPIAVTPSLQIVWMSKRKSKQGTWQAFSNPIVWNEFKHSYEIHLTNDNCAIPAAVDGTYTIPAAQSATATKVEVRLGLEIVDIKAEGITIECDKYIKKEGTDVYCLNDDTIVFDDDNPVYLAQFIAKKDGHVIARKTQSVYLNKGRESYHLRCFPNSRMWYGGNQYSVNSFNVQVYVSNSDGAYYEVDDISDYVIKYQLARSTTIYKIENIEDHTLRFQNETYDQDIYLQLYKGDKFLDDEVIDGIDYSKIKGKDHDGITIELNDQVNIPRSKMKNLEYIKNKTATRVVAYKSLKEYPIEDINVTAISCDAFETKLEVGYDEKTKQYYLASAMTGDVQMLYSITILVGGEEVLYEKVQNINVSNTLVDYELIPSVRHLCYNKNSGCNVSHINFTIRSGETNEKNEPIIPPHKIAWSIETDNDQSGFIYDDVFPTANLNKYLATCDGTLQTVSFQLLIEDQVADNENIEFWCEPSFDGYNYTIDLSNPHIEIPKAINNPTFSDKLKMWTTTDIVVCSSGEKLTTNTSEYPHFTVEAIDASFVVHDDVSDPYTYRVYFKPTVSLTTEQVNYTIKIKERAEDNYYVEFKRSQSVVFTDKEAYQLISRPTTINLNFAEEEEFQYTPIIQKMSYSGELIELTTDSELKAEKLNLYLDGEPYTLGTNFTIGKTRTDAIPVLLKDTSGYLYDYDDISLSRNGAPGSDGMSVEYIYGRVEDGTNNGILSKETYEGNQIVTISKNDRTSEQWQNGVEFGTITWYDDPQGIDETHQQEFISVSKHKENDDGTSYWTNFSKPKVHAQFGIKGEDGNGVEYIYTACQTLETTTIYEDPGKTKAIGFAVTNVVYNNGSYTDGEPLIIVGTHDKDGNLIKTDKKQDEDDFVLQGWFDNIPDLSEEYPNLYMSSRKKIKGVWGPFREPALWNKYSTNLELILNNDQVIIDDNSTADTVKELSYTEVQAFYKGKPVTGNVTTSTSTEVGGSFLEVVKDGDKDAFYLKLNPNDKLSSKTSGQVTYTFQYGTEKISRKQTVHIKDFSVGEGYKLMLNPSVVNTDNNDGKYSWPNTKIQFSVVKIHGAESEKVDLTTSNDIEVVVYRELEEQESESPVYYTIPASAEGGVEIRPDYSFVLRKSGVDVDIQNVIFSSKGADGAPGVSPFVLNLTDDTDSIFVNNDSDDEESGDTELQIYYKNNNIISDLNHYDVKLKDDTIDYYTVSVTNDYNADKSDNVDIQYDPLNQKIKYKIKKGFYKNINSEKKLKFPVKVTVNHDGYDSVLNTTYNVNIFKDVVRREIYCDYTTIKVTQQDDKTIITPSNLPVKIKEYNGNSCANKTLGNLREKCKIQYTIYNTDNNNVTKDLTNNEINNGYIAMPTNYAAIQKLESLELVLYDVQYDNLEIDREILPVIKDGKIGSNGTNGKSTAIRMRGEWNSTTQYYGGDRPDQTTGNDIYYVDVVSYNNNGEMGLYQAKKSNTNTAPTKEDTWHKVEFSALNLTEQLLITNVTDGKVLITGGFVDVEKAQKQKNPDQNITNDGIILWAGSKPNADSYESANSATFSVTRSGVIKATKGLFEGSYMPSVRTITQPKISNHINYQCATYNSDNTTTVYCNLDNNEITEGMKFNISTVNVTPQPIGKIKNIKELIYTKGVISNYYKIKFVDSDVKLANTINIDLPRGVYIPPSSNNLQASEHMIYNFIVNSFSYDFSNIFQENIGEYDPEDPWQIPAIKYVSQMINEGLSSNTNFNQNFTSEWFNYFKIPFISYLLNGESTKVDIPSTVTHPLLGLIGSDKYKKLLHSYLRWQLEAAIPFIGKTVTIYNKHANFSVTGILPESLQNLTTLVDTNNNLINLCKYLSRDETYSDNSNNLDFIQVRCVTKPLICGSGGKEYGYYICWERISDATGNFNITETHTPVKSEKDLNSFISFR